MTAVVAFFTPTLILGVPLFDIGFVIIARVVTGRAQSVYTWLAYTGRGHIHRFQTVGVGTTRSIGRGRNA